MQTVTQRSPFSVAVCALVVHLAALSSAQCPQGCAGASQAISADDGLPYINGCVAECQGVRVFNRRNIAMQPSDQRPVPETVILAHAAQGLHFVNFARVRRIQPNFRGNKRAVSAPALARMPEDRVLLFDASNGGVYATATPAQQMTATAAVDYAAAMGVGGDAYVTSGGQTSPSPAPGGNSEVLNPVIDVSPSPGPSATVASNIDTPPLLDVGVTTGGRRLLTSRMLQVVQVPDERVEVEAQPTGLPLSAVGQLLAYGQEWHCSASLVSERTIITAAHCVFDRISGAFARGLYFVPGRFRDSTGAVQAPFGGFDVSEVYIMSQYVSGAPQDMRPFDIAVVRLVQTAQIGKVVGHLGISVPVVAAAATTAYQPTKASTVSVESGNIQPTAAAAAAATTATKAKSNPAITIWQGSLATAGYPSDKPEGTLITTNCDAEQYVSVTADNTPGATLKLKCSTHLGQSGSPLVNSQHQVQGVVSFEVVGKDGYNGGCAVTPYLWTNLITPYLV